jgi:hypothetical protein
MEKPYIANMAYVPLGMVDNLESCKMELTVVPKKYNDDIPSPIFLYDLKTPGYIGVPIDWGLNKFSHLQFEDRTSRGNGLLLNATKKVDPYHRKAPKGQDVFIENIIKACSTHYTCFAVAQTGCHAKDTKVMTSDGRFKEVQHIVEGDYLMGIDSKPKKVNKLYRGSSMMYEVTPVKGEKFICNEDHILRLISTRNKKGEQRKFIDITIKDYLTRSKYFKHRHKLYRVPIEFANQYISMPAYVLGLLIGDGKLHEQVGFTNSNKVLTSEVNKYATSIGDIYRGEEHNNTTTYYYKGCNLRSKLEEIGLYNVWAGDKYIPDNYKYNSRKIRLDILAGLLDTDGYTDGKSFEFSSKSKVLADDVVYLCRSIGLSAYSSEKIVKGTSYHIVSISGECSIIPTKVKVAKTREQVKDPLVTGFSVTSKGEGEFYGFNVEDSLYLLQDFIVTHNSGKSVSALAAASHFNMRTLVVVDRKLLANQWKDEIIDKVGIDISRIALISGKASKNMKASICVGIVKTLVDNDFGEDFYNSFGTVILDEIHAYGSEKFSKVVNLFNSTITIGMTATDERGDEAEFCYRSALGPHRAVSTAESMPITVYKVDYTNTPLYGDNPQYQLSQLVKDINRNRIAAEMIAEAYENGRQILVGADRINHLEEVMERCINLGVPREVCGLLTGQRTEKGKRVKVTTKESEYIKKNCQVIFSTYAICNKGLDIPRLDYGIQLNPRSRIIQFAGRFRRLFDNKPDPILVDFADNHSHIFKAQYRKRYREYMSINATVIEGKPKWQ